jgi:iron complex transport system substrate-binding protein
MRYLAIVSLLVGFVVLSCNSVTTDQSVAEKEVEVKRIVSLSGTITEVLFALDANDQLVAVDVTSTYPEESTKKLPNLGHVRGVTAESVLAVKPTDVVCFEDELNPQLKRQLEAAKVNVVVLKRDFSVESTKKVIAEMAEWLGKKAKGAELVAQIDKDLKKTTDLSKKLKVLFVYARGAGTLMVAGDNTQMTEMIRLAGGQNAVNGFADFKPLTAEAVVTANPDVILMFDSGKSSLSDAGGVMGIPGVKSTTAGKKNAVITMDGQLLSGFGPRVGVAISTLNKELNSLK